VVGTGLSVRYSDASAFEAVEYSLYRNTRTRCGSLALLCAQGSPATLRRVLYQKLPWSRRLGEGFVPGLVSKGGSLVRDDTSWQRFTRVAGAVSGAWSSRVNQPVGGRQVVFLLWPEGQGKVPPGIRRWGLQPAYSLLEKLGDAVSLQPNLFIFRRVELRTGVDLRLVRRGTLRALFSRETMRNDIMPATLYWSTRL
jgi:hypothetical protein